MRFCWGLCFVLFAQTLLGADNQIIILLGKPGAGKGTYAIKLRKDFNLPHISTGELLKENIRQGTPLGKIAKNYVESGTFLPDHLVVEMFFEYYQKQQYRGCILDGFPRTLNQAILFDEKLGSSSKITVVYLKVSDQLATKRILGRLMCEKCYATYNIPSAPPKTPGICDLCLTPLYHRQDDSIEIIKTRLCVFHEMTAPLVPYYQNQHRLHEIDSDQSIDTIYDSIVTIVQEESCPLRTVKE